MNEIAKFRPNYYTRNVGVAMLECGVGVAIRSAARPAAEVDRPPLTALLYYREENWWALICAAHQRFFTLELHPKALHQSMNPRVFGHVWGVSRTWSLLMTVTLPSPITPRNPDEKFRRRTKKPESTPCLIRSARR